MWGEIESKLEDETEVEEGENDIQQIDNIGLITPSGFTSILAGIETPKEIELRKKKIKTKIQDTVEITLDPSELDMDSTAMATRYEQHIREKWSHCEQKDQSSTLVEDVAGQKVHGRIFIILLNFHIYNILTS